MSDPAGFARAAFWELVQNLPMVAGFVGGVTLWREGAAAWAVAAMLAGSLLGAVAIYLTEPKIVAGHREPVGVLVTNMIVLTGLMIVVAAYLAAGWGNFVTDIVAGAGGGLVLAIAQDVAARQPVGWRHLLAFGLALPPSLMLIRWLLDSLPLAGVIVLVAIVMSALIALIDYGPVYLWKRPAGGE